MRRALLCLIASLLLSLLANATTLTVNCDRAGPLGKVNTYLKFLNPLEPNTLKVNGTCHENIVVNSFDRLSLIANPGAILQDPSGGLLPVLQIVDSQRIKIQGFNIIGGSVGISCIDESLCRLSENTIKGATQSGVEVNESRASLNGDILEDNGNNGLAIDASNVTASGVTVQNTGGVGVNLSDNASLTADGLDVENSRASGIFINGHSALNLLNSKSAHNVYDGVTVITQSFFFVLQVTATENGGSGVSIDGMSIVDFYGGGNFTGSGNGVDIACGSPHGTAWHLENATYGSTTCSGAAATMRPQTAKPLAK